MSTARTAPQVNSSGYTLGEEIANAVTSGIGTALSIAGLVVMVVYAALDGSAWHVVGVSIFGASLIFSHLASTLYHAISPPRAKHVFRVIDHLAIYVLIAGTYTPFTLVNLRGAWGWSLLVLIWLLGLAGVLIKTTALRRIRYLSTAFYVAMGWTVVLVIRPLLESVAPGGIWLLLAGGLSYTAGVAFFAWDRLPYNHAIWHLFVIGGSACHFFAVLFYVVPLAPSAAMLSQGAGS
ncbi:PAQR family membrane homeostasis protein TrhA [Salinisphaera hydrothermalis]|uniref:Hemolysin III family channel protein n=1 Tax=Salinisphaera hydrothermalis (strain C41B8) TaxID=1304275 RepID=A0A084IQI3_SALHC|nr:hemolysin III family protein [Salinisphaera hydrothermalis]KEZ78967.1 hemolysin III family channel protein [Salinisphaera hydrothermalis C41B8]